MSMRSTGKLSRRTPSSSIPLIPLELCASATVESATNKYSMEEVVRVL